MNFAIGLAKINIQTAICWIFRSIVVRFISIGHTGTRTFNILSGHWRAHPHILQNKFCRIQKWASDHQRFKVPPELEWVRHCCLTPQQETWCVQHTMVTAEYTFNAFRPTLIVHLFVLSYD